MLYGSSDPDCVGKTVEQVQATWAAGYDPREITEQDPDLRRAINLIDSGLFSHGDRHLFRPLTDDLRNSDPFLVCADFHDYFECQERVDAAYLDDNRWARMSILNAARSGFFSSDRAIREYAEDIWDVAPLPVES